MKAILPLILLCVSVSLLTHAQSGYQIQVDSVTETRYNDSTQTWDFNRSEKYSYNWDGSLAKRVVYRQEYFLRGERNYFTYQAGKLTEQKWWTCMNYLADSTMYYKGRKVFSYDMDDNLLSMKMYLPDSNMGEYVDLEIVNTYNPNGDKLTQSTLEWNDTLLRLDTLHRFFYSYQNGRKFQDEYKTFDIITRVWSNKWKMVYLYDSLGNLSNENYYSWNGNTQSYILSRETQYSYNSAQQCIESLTSFPSIAVSYRDYYTYDIHGNHTHTVYDITYDGNQWQTESSTQYSYDSSYLKDEAANDPQYPFGQSFFPPLVSVHAPLQIKMVSIYTDTLRRVYHYSGFPVNLATSEKGEVRIHPNPAHAYITMEFENNNGPALLSIYDIAGKRVQMQHIKSEDRISVQASRKGLYMYTVQVNNTIYSGKFVKY